MVIHGLQKMTLLDFPGKVACTIFLGWCDFRCPFCHNWELIDGSAPAELDDEKLMDFLKKRQGLLEGVAITGGEPMLNKDLPELMRKIRELGYPVKVDTNGNHPEMLRRVIDEKLVDYIAMDVKNSRERYAQTIGLEKFDTSNVEKSIGIIMGSGIEYEFRTTVVEQLHDNDSFKGIGTLIEGADRYFLQKFTDRDTVPFEGLSAP
ncbi:MAG: anaerobic ribonucleoside-triphosphate reductase activating protein, partial [Prevotellaceae bacterium]|nr:anaerobic ribonucleoside-triphosphate reductase activating protein [Prevotellaceae bacterium]